MAKDKAAGVVQYHREDPAYGGVEDSARLEVLHDDQGVAGHALRDAAEGFTAASTTNERIPGQKAHLVRAQRASNGKLL